MLSNNLLFKDIVEVIDGLSVRIPTTGEILEDESNYYSMVSMLTAMPIDMIVLLDDVGVSFEDFSAMDDYDLFLLLFPSLKTQNTNLIFGDLDISKFVPGVNEETQQVVLVNTETGVEINRAVQRDIADLLRRIHGLKKDTHRPANETAFKYLAEKERKRLKRMAREPQKSHLESLIVALVNTEQFPYRYNEVRDLTIYQLNESVRQIVHKIDYDNRMRGIYAGTISAKDMSQDDFNWLEHK